MGKFKQVISHEAILEVSTNGILVTDNDGVVVYLNRRAKDRLKVSDSEGIDAPAADLIPQIGREIMNCLGSGKSIIGCRLTENGINAVANITPIVIKDEVAGAAVSFKDMDEFEKRAEELESYKKQNKLLEAIFHASFDGLWIMDPKGVLVAWNPAAELITGFKAEEMVGKRFTELEGIGIPKEDIRYVKEAIETQRRVSTFNVHPRSNKRVLGNATPVLDDDGNLLWIVGNEHDLTELNTMKEDLDNALKLTEKAKDELTDMSLLELREQAIVAESKPMQQVLKLALKLGRYETIHILITGASGTGKGLLAKFVHKNSARSTQPFIQINCAAMPENLLEAELFGYEKGAFTGASDKGKAGLIELAHNGTLFLDEIGDMPIQLQSKLLKYLDDHEVMRLGAVTSRKIACCIISATNKNLEKSVEEKRFRQDLFFRLNNFTIHIPPLRDRTEDIFELVKFYIDKYNKEYKKNKRVSAAGLDMIQSYGFPGNVRELKSMVKRAVLMSEESRLDDYFSESMNTACFPKADILADQQTPEHPREEFAEMGEELIKWMGALLAKRLNAPEREAGSPNGSDVKGKKLMLSHLLGSAVRLGNRIYAEAHKQMPNNSKVPDSVQTEEPPPVEPNNKATPPAKTNLNSALEAYEREILIDAMDHCHTIRKLAEYLQTSPATALRKLRKHGLSL